MLATEAVLSGLAPDASGGESLLGRLTPTDLPSEAHALSGLVGLALLVLTPRLWRGTRTAVSLAIVGLGGLAALNLFGGHYGEGIVQLALASMLALGRGSFRLGCRNRPRLTVVCAAAGAWALAYTTLRLAPLVHAPTHETAQALHRSVVHTLRLTVAGTAHLSENWTSLIELLIVGAALISVLALRSLLRPAGAENACVASEYLAARAIVDQHGVDSLSPFVLRPDKALHFGAGGVLSYRVIRGTAIVSSDPVAPGDAAPEVMRGFLALARRRGWPVAMWGVSGRYLDAYRELGLRAICVGEEAFVDPSRFNLEGRAVRKLRQSVHRVRRRGWEICAHEGRGIDGELEAEIDALEDVWRRGQRSLLGFAMSMGAFVAEVAPDDLYVLARSPEGRLGAVMRFAAHSGKLSLDTMRRVGATPNGLNEAMVCHALEFAREREVAEVSLNYAGLAHLVRSETSRRPAARIAARLPVAILGRRFQMERLVRFNEKFSPEWRPRYLVYESRAALPRAIVRVLQVEGYLSERPPVHLPKLRPARPGTVARPRHAKSAG